MTEMISFTAVKSVKVESTKGTETDITYTQVSIGKHDEQRKECLMPSHLPCMSMCLQISYCEEGRKGGLMTSKN